MIPRHVSTPSRINGAAKSPSPESEARKEFEYDPSFAMALLEGSAEVKNIKLENELLHQETKEVKKGSSCTEISGIPINRPDSFESKFILVHSLGSGGFGRVFKCTHRLDNADYAVKEVSIAKGFNDDGSPTGDLVLAMQEVKNLADLSHPNIIRSNQCWLENSHENSKLLYL